MVFVTVFFSVFFCCCVLHVDNSPAEVIVRAQKTIEYVIREFLSLKDIFRSLHVDERPPHGIFHF